MRRYRRGLIQTPEQLRFSYTAILMGAKDLINNEKNDVISDDDKEESVNRKRPWDAENSNESSAGSFDSNGGEHDSLRSTTLPLKPKYKRSFGISQSDEDGLDVKQAAGEESPATLTPVPTSSPEPTSTQSTSSNASISPPINNNIGGANELRRRAAREERNQKMLEKINQIKEKQKDAEERSRLKSRVVVYAKYGCLGLALLISAGLVYNYFPTGDRASTSTNFS